MFNVEQFMTPNPQIVKSIEQLNYRVTVGDVAAQAGLQLNLAQQGLLALASDAGGHLQVAESGDIIYSFPKNFRSILRNKYWQLRWQQWWSRIWRILFYLIRISFGIILIASILLMLVAVIAIFIAMSASRGDDDDRGGYDGGGGSIFMPHFWIGPDIFWWFDPGYNSQRRQRLREATGETNLSFLEAIFSFLFGDGDPNSNLEIERWETIGTAITNNQGAVISEQIAPYVDKVDEYEDYMLPVLSRFNGYPEVSPQGEIIYYFPELQVTAATRQERSIFDYLPEKLWRFSQASSGQIMVAVGLGSANLILALILGSLLRDGTVAAQIGGLVAFVGSIYWILLAYGVAFLTIPLIRYFWLQGRNQKIANRNETRQARAMVLNSGEPALRQKINYAKQFARQKVISDRDITYTTETDLLDQNLENKDRLDRDWEERLGSGS
jgi:flagellar basal body-associated protein FliL